MFPVLPLSTCDVLRSGDEVVTRFCSHGVSRLHVAEKTKNVTFNATAQEMLPGAHNIDFNDDFLAYSAGSFPTSVHRLTPKAI